VSKRKSVGSFNNAHIYKIIEIKFIPFENKELVDCPNEIRNFIAEIKKVPQKQLIFVAYSE
jgi:hypothetical protein